jgi:hypothetical protein
MMDLELQDGATSVCPIVVGVPGSELHGGLILHKVGTIPRDG